MQQHRPFRPALETLEDRTVPATIRFVSGSLFISNQNAALTLAPQGGTVVKVTDGALVTTFTGVGNIYVTGTNKADTVTVDTAAGGFNSNLSFNMGNSNDVVNLVGANPILGNVMIMGGRGNDTAVFSGAAYGNVLLQDMLGTADTAVFGGGQGTQFLGNITTLGANIVVFGANTTVNGRTTVLNINESSTSVAVDSVTTTFGGDVQIRTGSGNDTVVATGIYLGNLTVDVGGAILSNTVVLTGAVNGNASISGGTGADIFTVALTPGNAVAGNLSLNAGDGDNSLNLAAGDVSGNLSVQVGNGNNTYSPFGMNVAGSAQFHLGNGNNTLAFASGSIGGDLSVEAGNGTNVTTLTGTTLAGRLRYRSGNGTNTLNVTPAVATLFNLDVLFGNGNDTFTANANATLNGTINGGTGTDTFVQGGAILVPTLTIASFEA